MRRNRRSHSLFGMVFVAVLLATAFEARAQTSSQPSPSASPTPSLEKEFFRNVLRDQKAIWTAPFRLQSSDARWMVPSGIGLMALITTDRITGDKLGAFDRQVRASRTISYAGAAYSLGAVAAGFYLVGRQKNDDRARETGLLSAEALVDSMIVESVLKGVTQRARPLAGVERSEFFDGGSSFPSGHSTHAWAVATVIANEYHHRAVQIAAYSVASAVSVARFTGHKHYLSDVVAGSALGYAIGKYVYNTHHRKSIDSVVHDEPAIKSWRPVITPEFDRRAREYGIAMRWSF